MSDNQDALRLADALEAIHENNSDSLLALNVIRQAGPELRRLHALNAELVEALKWIGDHDLKGCDLVVAGYMAHGFIDRARAALAKVEANK